MKFVEFNGKKLWYVHINGVNWVVVKSVCEALNINDNRQRQEILKDPILKAAVAHQQQQVPPDTQKREWFCLREEYIYGWIFSIQSDKPELVEYKRECYIVLYNHFHRLIIRRSELYREMAVEKKLISDFEDKISKIEGYDRYMESKMRYARLWKQVKETASEPDLFDDENILFK